MSKMNLAKKLSMKILVGNVANYIPMKEIEEQKNGKTITKEVPNNGATVMLVNVAGLARGIRTGSSNFGDWTALTGDFVAEALVGDKAGQKFRTGQLFLPDVALNLILPVVEEIGRNGAVEMAFSVGITAEATSNTGYEYTAQFLMEPAENDPLETLIAKAMPALPAPEKDEEKDKKAA